MTDSAKGRDDLFDTTKIENMKTIGNVMILPEDGEFQKQRNHVAALEERREKFEAVRRERRGLVRLLVWIFVGHVVIVGAALTYALLRG